MSDQRASYLLAFVAGFASMSVEMTSARALAPFFGTSAFIWAAIIGSIMGLIFIGSISGGWAADKGYGIDKVCWVHVAAAVLITIVSQGVIFFLYAYFDRLPDTVSVLAFVIFFSVVIISAPVYLLSATSPWLIGILSNGTNGAGGISGRIYGISTLGGLLGTFLPVLFLVPLIGSRWTFVITSLSVLITSASIAMSRKLEKKYLLIALLPLAVLPLYLLPVSAPAGITYQTESPFNSIWVREDGRHIDLLVNERKAIQTRIFNDKSILPYDVWGLYLTAPLFSMNTGKKRVLFLGLGAGGSAYYYNKYFPEYELVGVEIDGAIIEAGKRYFGLNKLSIRIVCSDARPFLSRETSQYDIIIADAFVFPYLPTHLSTVEFMKLVNNRLAAGGVALFNVGRFKQYEQVVNVIAQTGLTVFRNAYSYKVKNDSNTLIYFANHSFGQTYHPQSSISPKLLQLSEMVKQDLKEISRTADPISTDDRPLTEWLTNQIALQAFGVI